MIRTRERVNLIATTIVAFAISQSSVALAGSDPAYKNVFNSDGIVCNGQHVESLRPILADDGYFICQCSTDMDCVINNPHRQEYNGEIEPTQAARAPKGTSCSNPISWAEAQHNVGRTLVVVGPVVNVTTSTKSHGNPTWINVGGKFPNANRFTLVVWDNSQTSLKLLNPKQLEGRFICAIGKISNYRGVPQIELRNAGDFRISQ